MIFKDELCQAVLDGNKTQTRRLVRVEERYISNGAIPATVYAWHKIKWQVGRTYAIQPGRGKKAVGRFRLTEIRQERLQDIDEAGAIAEGVQRGKWYKAGDLSVFFSAREMFGALWDSIHRKGDRWVDNPEVWVLEFELC